MDHSAPPPSTSPVHTQRPVVNDSQESAAVRKPPWRAALLMVGLIGAFFLLREHWSHVLGVWPYLLLLACPLMHLFHGHGGHGHHSVPGNQPPASETSDARPR